MKRSRCILAIAGSLYVGIQPASFGQAGVTNPVIPTRSNVNITNNVSVPTKVETPVIPVETRTEIKTPQFQNPFGGAGLFGAGTILPTDTLLRNVHLNGSGDEEYEDSGGKQEFGAATPGRVFAFSDLKNFLLENGWDGEIASDWLLDFNPDKAVEEDAGNDDGQLPTLIPIAYQEAAVSASDAQPVVLKVNRSCRELQIFSQANQVLCRKEQLLAGAPGTILSEHADYLTLHMGSLVIDSGKSQCNVATKIAGLKIEKNSTCQIEYLPEDKLVVRALYTDKGSAAKIKLAKGSDRVIELRQGEELSLNLHNPAGSAAVLSKIEQKPNVLSGKFAGDDSKYINRMEKRLEKSGFAQAQKQAELEAGAIAVAAGPISALASEDSCLTANARGEVALLSGRILFHTNSKQILQSRLGDIYMQPGAIAAVEAKNGMLRVQCCTEPRSVLLVSKKFGTPLHWGMEAMIVDHAATWEEAFPTDGVARRSFEIHRMNSNNCVLSDFQMFSLLKKASHLAPIRKPANDEQFELRNRLLKTAAALQLVTGKKGNYQVRQNSETHL